MLMVLFSWVIIGGASLLFGKAVVDAVYGNRREDMGRPDVYIVTGLIVLNVYAQLFSLFYKVAGIADTILGAVGILLFCVWVFQRFGKGKRITFFPGVTWERLAGWRIAAVLFCSVLTLVWTTRSPSQYDTGLYHAQAIRWIEDYGVVPGLGNLHMRLAYNSAFMSLQALFSLGWLVGQSLHSLNGFFCLAALIYVCATIRLLGEKSLRTSDFLKCVMVIFVVQKRYDIASSGTDIWAMLLVLYIFVKWSECWENSREDGALYGWLCLVGVYAATVKLSAASVAVLALYPLYLFIREKKGKAAFAHVAAGMFILMPYLIRNVIISGYLVYPYGGLDLFHLDWKMDKAVLVRDSLDIKMFARGITNPAEYDDSYFGWIPGWFLKQETGNRILIVAGLLCIPVILYLLAVYFRRKEYACAALLGTGIVNLLFWMVTAPHMRYGGPYIHMVVALTLGTAVCLAGRKDRSAGREKPAAGGGTEKAPVWRKPLAIVTAAVLVLSLLQYGQRLSKLSEMEPKDLVRQPDYLSWQSTQYPVDNVHIWKPDEGDLSGYFAFPATPQGGQLQVLRLRGESFQEGFRHE